jgi:hypothetical protein
VSKQKEWAVDWQVDVDVQLAKTITHAASEIIEAATAEEAVEKIKDEMHIDVSDLDISSQVADDDFDVDSPDMDTFEVTTKPQEWTY